MSFQWIDQWLRVGLPVLVLCVGIGFGLSWWAVPPHHVGVGNHPDQPIPFSHKLHAGEMQIDCQYCHTTVAKSWHASVPSTQICMNCHAVARIDQPSIKKLKEYYDSNTPIPWNRVHRLPHLAQFSHAVHVAAGVDCQECHGNVKEMETAQQVKSLGMGVCLTCHRNPHEKLPYLKQVNFGPENCSACHY